jgi:4-hydroxy-3-polyprenylbenzoate decarboxylase
VLERIDWKTDLHFYTNTTIDTLDYSGDSWNGGSKLVVSCNRNKWKELDSDLKVFDNLPWPFKNVRLIQKGIVAIEAGQFKSYEDASVEINILETYLQDNRFQNFPLLIICDDAEFLTHDYKNFLWVSFTRSNPAFDIYGVKSRTRHKHWSCEHNLIIDARIKPHHAPVLEVDPATTAKVDEIVFKNPVLKKILK